LPDKVRCKGKITKTVKERGLKPTRGRSAPIVTTRKTNQKKRGPLGGSTTELKGPDCKKKSGGKRAGQKQGCVADPSQTKSLRRGEFLIKK